MKSRPSLWVGFFIGFVVGKDGQKPESFADIDGAASNGTVLMAKLVTGLALPHQMQDKRHTVRAACYLDEALALDGPNQTSLIETAAEFGFALVKSGVKMRLMKNHRP